MYSCNDDTTSPGTSAWLTEGAYLSPSLSQIQVFRQTTKYVFQCTDGQRFTFAGTEGALALSYVIDKEINARLLPGAIAAYDAGRPVSFGAIQVSQEGLQVGHKTIPWQNILSIEMEGDQIIVRLPDWEHWVGNSKTATPNVSVFKALIHYIGAREKNLMDVGAHPELVFSHKRVLRRKRKHHRNHALQ
jgi:hypothetical protein